jgi:hypothetical protein
MAEATRTLLSFAALLGRPTRAKKGGRGRHADVHVDYHRVHAHE